MSAASGATWRAKNPEKAAQCSEEARRRKARYRGVDITPQVIADHLYHRWGVEDVERWLAYAKEKGALPIVKTVTLERLETMDLVPNEPFRDAWPDLGRARRVYKDIFFTLARMERRDGVPEGTYGRTDESGVRRALGLETHRQSSKLRISLFCDYQLAEACCFVMNLVPRECGI